MHEPQALSQDPSPHPWLVWSHCVIRNSVFSFPFGLPNKGLIYSYPKIYNLNREGHLHHRIF